MHAFLELLTHFHRWCSSAEAFPDTPVAWLAAHGLEPPGTLDDWLSLGRTPVGAWGPATLPAGWNPSWRILSRRERTLTVEALEYLEHHIPGAMAAAPPQPSGGASPQPEIPASPDTHEAWSLDAMIDCITREVTRRERVYADVVRAARMTWDDAAQAIGQMRAVLRYLQAHRRNEASPQTASKTASVPDEAPRQEPLF